MLTEEQPPECDSPESILSRALWLAFRVDGNVLVPEVGLRFLSFASTLLVEVDSISFVTGPLFVDDSMDVALNV